MKRQTCKDCLHCKVRVETDTPGRGLVAFCDMNSWPERDHTEMYRRLFGPGTAGGAVAAEYAEGCLYYEDMAG